MPPHAAYVSYPPHQFALHRYPAQELPPPEGNEFQRWQHTFDVRAPVISVANLVLVFLLKLNRIVVPAIVRWLRTRRAEWIKRADIDVARELHDHPNRRELCAGACCRDTYGTFPLNDSQDHKTDLSANLSDTSPSAEKDEQTRGSALGSMVNMMQSWVSAFEADDTDSDNSDVDGTRRRTVYRERVVKKLAATSENPEEDIYYRLRAVQEERHREMFIGQFNYSEVVAMYMTLISLVVYSAVIIAFVLSHFEFTFREAWIFSVSLVMTGITSEIDTLVMFQRRIKAGAKHMLPGMPGFYALQSLTEQTRLMSTSMMEGVERGAERMKKRSKKKRNRARRGPEVVPLNGYMTKAGDEGHTADVEAAA